MRLRPVFSCAVDRVQTKSRQLMLPRFRKKLIIGRLFFAHASDGRGMFLAKISKQDANFEKN